MLDISAVASVAPFLQKVCHAQSREDIGSACIGFSKCLGYTDYLIAARMAFAGHDPVTGYITSLPDHVVAEYFASETFEYDPTLEHAQTTVTPIHWCDLDPNESQHVSAMLKTAATVNAEHGVAYPMHGAGADNTILILTGRSEPMHDPSERYVLDACAIPFLVNAHANICSVLLSERSDMSGIALTQKERDVLKRVARGQSIQTIAASLDLSTRTVDFHLTNARLKLRASNRSHAVAQGIATGQIPAVASS